MDMCQKSAREDRHSPLGHLPLGFLPLGLLPPGLLPPDLLPLGLLPPDLLPLGLLPPSGRGSPGRGSLGRGSPGRGSSGVSGSRVSGPRVVRSSGHQVMGSTSLCLYPGMVGAPAIPSIGPNKLPLVRWESLEEANVASANVWNSL